jgi:hypothetical protein
MIVTDLGCCTTHRLLAALAHGIPVLTPKWLRDCTKTGKVIVPGEETRKGRYVVHARAPELEAHPLFSGMEENFAACVHHVQMHCCNPDRLHYRTVRPQVKCMFVAADVADHQRHWFSCSLICRHPCPPGWGSVGAHIHNHPGACRWVTMTP